MGNTELGARPHNEAEVLLPWYATGQLAELDRVRVEVHLSSCEECRNQLLAERRLVDEFRAITPEMESGWARLKARIGASGASAPRSRPSPVGDLWSLMSRPAMAGLAAAQLAFVVLAATVLVYFRPPAYHTLGSAQAPSSANLIVMFRPGSRVEDVQRSLRSAGTSIVQGPTEAGAFLLHVAPQHRAAALSQLRAGGEIELAEPIDREPQ